MEIGGSFLFGAPCFWVKKKSPLQSRRVSPLWFCYSMNAVVVHGNCRCGDVGGGDHRGGGACASDCGGHGDEGGRGDGAVAGAGADAEGFRGHGSDVGGEEGQTQQEAVALFCSVLLM